MAIKQPLAPSAPWFRLELEPADWERERPADLVQWFAQMLLVRRFEERLLELEKAGLIHGPAHTSIGQEAGAVGAMSVLGTQDKINGTHRAHHQVLIKLINAAMPPGFDVLTSEFTAEMDDAIYRFMAEIMGLQPGYCGGRGGSMHMRHADSGIMGSSAIVGGNPPHAVGYALADKMLGRKHVSVTFFGDGAAQAGATCEAMNIAAAQSVPAIFFIENNLYAVATHIRDVTRETRQTSRGAMFGIPSIECDGMDVVAVHHAMREALRFIEETGGPVVIEAMCYRHLHQSGGRIGSDLGYRSADEEREWRQRDPVTVTQARLGAMGILSADDVARIDGTVTARVAAAAARLTEPVPGGNALRIPDRLWPDPATVDHGILGDLSELQGARFLDHDALRSGPTEKIKFAAAASEAIASAMDRDPAIIVLGEDVHQMRGGVSGFTKAALERWPSRVLPMSIAENGFTGVALGAALNGLRPIVEIMFGDFCFVAADQIGNGVSKVRHMFGDGFPVPVVMRCRVSPHTGYGSQHAGDPSALFALFPGWRIFYPTTAFDYIGMMNASLRCNDPVLILEHTLLYQREFEVPKGDRDYCIPFGSARIVRPGSLCTVLATGIMVENSMKAADELGLDAEIIDVRNLDHHGIDWTTIGDSIERTGRILVAEQTSRSLSLGARWIAEIQNRFFDCLDHEILHVTGSLSAPTVSAVLNRASLGGVDDVKQALSRLAATA